jgi:hypothetical protein
MTVMPKLQKLGSNGLGWFQSDGPQDSKFLQEKDILDNQSKASKAQG